jgi:hypothetical protein
MPPPGYLIDRYKEYPTEQMHMILLPYFELLSSLGTSTEIFEFTARPGDWFRSQHEKVRLLAPPLIMFSGGRGVKNGLAQNWTNDDIFPYFELAGLAAACQRLLTDCRPYQFCPHEQCPMHETALCSGWYAVPHRIPWSECRFPESPSGDFIKDCIAFAT